MARISSAAYVTAVLQFLQAFNRNDLDACERFLDPQIEWHSAVSYNGREAVRAMLESYGERFSRPQIRPDDFRASAEHVLMIVCFHEADSDAQPREQRQSWIVDMNEEGHLRRVLAYPSPAEAARAFEALSAAALKVQA
jgi:ketosteroid isomerase-like protein